MEPEPTVYIVDDDSALTEVLEELMREIGLEAETYGTAAEFLAAYRLTGPGCLVLDVRMPGMSGLELQEKLVDDGTTLPIIFITGHADVPMAVEAMKAGAWDFFEKPFRSQDLCDTIQKAVEKDKQKRRRQQEEESVERRMARLTPGEREVYHLVAQGKTNDEIAAMLGLSVRGVESRRSKLMAKLRVKTKAELLELTASAAT
jgi:two-component system, LuxR family, response regulator FixJ